MLSIHNLAPLGCSFSPSNFRFSLNFRSTITLCATNRIRYSISNFHAIQAIWVWFDASASVCVCVCVWYIHNFPEWHKYTHSIYSNNYNKTKYRKQKHSNHLHPKCWGSQSISWWIIAIIIEKCFGFCGRISWTVTLNNHMNNKHHTIFTLFSPSLNIRSFQMVTLKWIFSLGTYCRCSNTDTQRQRHTHTHTVPKLFRQNEGSSQF